MTTEQYAKFQRIVELLTAEMDREKSFYDLVNKALEEQYAHFCRVLDAGDARTAEIVASITQTVAGAL